MAKRKYTFNDIKIGDRVLTTSNDTGTVIALKSYAYLNDKFIRKSNVPDTLLVDLLPFQNDNVKHRGVYYATVTISIEDFDKVYNKTYYYVENIDLSEIKQIIKDTDNEKISLYEKIIKIIKQKYELFWNKCRK